MKPSYRFRSLVLLSPLLLSFGPLATLRAEDILFFGNSFTSSNDIPKMVEAIAVSKGKAVTVMAVTKGGQGFPYHLGNPATDPALESKPWNWVVLQDYSLAPTHARKVEDFMKYGQAFYDRIVQKSPAAGVVLYETWAFSPKHALFTAAEGKKAQFASPDELTGELQKNYAALQAVLQAKDPKRPVLVAPVGTAFANCVRTHPDVNLFAPDFKHPNVDGSYLSALVIYATVYKDSPLGAAPGKKVKPADAKILQEVAEATIKAASTGK